MDLEANMDTKAFETETKRHKEVMDTLIEDLKNQILKLPDNPNTKRMSDSPSCFIMDFGHFGSNWSPKYYDFKKQYEVVVDELSKCKPDKVIERFEKIIVEGRIRLHESQTIFEFHPEVITLLVALGGYRWKSIAIWPEGTCSTSEGKDISHDFHASRGEAEGVCRMLCSDGFGGGS